MSIPSCIISIGISLRVCGRLHGGSENSVVETFLLVMDDRVEVVIEKTSTI